MGDLDARLHSAQYAAAREIARRAHEGQLYGDGTYFDEHLLRVVARVAHRGIDAMTVALLHDIVEDTPVSLSHLHTLFPADIVDDVSFLTHKKSDPYADYIHDVCEAGRLNILYVKQADLECHIAAANSAFWREKVTSKWSPALAEVLQAIHRLEAV